MEICEINRYIKGYSQKEKEEQKKIIINARYTAVFNNQKKIPSLEEVLKSFDKKEKNKLDHLKKIKQIKEKQ